MRAGLSRWFWSVLLVVSWAGLGWAQAPVELARQAVQDWQAGRYLVDPSTAVGGSTEELIDLLRRQINFLPAPEGLQVNLTQPQVGTELQRTVVKFPAALGQSGGEVVVVVRGGEVTRVVFEPEGGLLPSWISSPVAWVLFGLFSLLAVASLFRPGWWLTLWQQGWQLVRQYRRLYLWVNVWLYGLYIVGGVVAYSQPEWVKLAQELAVNTLEQIGLSDQPRSLIETALLIFYWNFQNGLLTTTAFPGLLGGIPALLINTVRYFVLGFALSPSMWPLEVYAWHIPTIVIELQAYILVTFGSLVLLARLLKREGYRAGVQALGLTIFLALFFLLVGAWYEALEVRYLLP